MTSGFQNFSVLAQGAAKLLNRAHKPKIRASAEQTRQLAQMAKQANRPDMADSFVVARHLCLRFVAEVMQMEGDGENRSLRCFEQDGRRAMTYVLRDRKMFLEPTEVFRRCICQRQGKRLCGVCIIHQPVLASCFRI